MRAHKLRIGKIDEYLFTRLHTSTMAGLPGMLLSRDANDAGGLLAGKQVVAHGLPGTRKYVNAFRQYIYEDLNVTVDDIGEALGVELGQGLASSGADTPVTGCVHA